MTKPQRKPNWLMLIIFCSAASLTCAALFENFEGYATGLVSEVTNGKWVSPNAARIVEDNWNKFLDAGGNNRAYAPLGTFAIPAADTQTTVFFRVFGAGGEDSLIGVTDNAAPSSFGNMQAYIQFVNGNLTARNGGGNTVLMSGIAPGWFNIWLVVNNSANTYDIYVNQGAANATAANRLGTGFAFRYASANPLVSFANVYGQGLKFDDVYITPGLDLTNPPLPSTPPAPYPWTGFLGTRLTLENGGFTEPGTATAGFAGIPHWYSFATSWSNDTGTRSNDQADGDGWHLSVFCPDGAFYNVTPTTMVEGQRYTFLAQCRARWNCDGVTMSVIAGDDPNIVLASEWTRLVHEDGWLPASVTYTATAADAGKYIGVMFEGTSASNINNSWLRTDNVRLYEGYEVLHGAVTPVPANRQESIEPSATLELSWTPSNDPNFIGQALYYYVGPKANPDLAAYNAVSGIALSTTDSSYTINISYEQYCLWRVDTHVDYDPNALVGQTWFFTTEPIDFPPIVQVGNSYITWLGNMPQSLLGTVDDRGEDDVANADVVWSIQSLPWEPQSSAMRVIARTSNMDVLAAAGYNANMLREWIGTDTRGHVGDPMVLTLSGLPAGIYSWNSYHHDAADQSGVFDVTIVDAAGSATTAGVTFNNGTNLPVTEFGASLVSDGSPVKLIFYAGSAFFVMNGFELSDGVNTLQVDFQRPDDPDDSGWATYTAQNQVANSFTAQNFALGDATVTVHPQWGAVAAGLNPYATVTKTSGHPLTPTAVFDTNWPGDYTIVLTATDAGGQSDSKTLTVRVAQDACAARQMAQSGYSFADFNQDCIVDLNDFAIWANEWLSDIRLTESWAY